MGLGISKFIEYSGGYKMTDRMSFSFGIENKKGIESIIGYSDLIPENELYVQRGTDYATKLNGAESEVSIALVARADRNFSCRNYTIGYIENAKVVLNDECQSG
ncbi:MAG: hypothetical protein U9R34_03250 [Nanoarchaeota archaeon]|nr:hypothetical protein [Nanoarchaeota archaeon]